MEIWQEKREPCLLPVVLPYGWWRGGEKREVSVQERDELKKAGADTPRKCGMEVGDCFNLQDSPLELIEGYYLPYTSRLAVDDDCYHPDPSNQRASLVHDLFSQKMVEDGAKLDIRAVTDPVMATVEHTPGRGRSIKLFERRERLHRQRGRGTTVSFDFPKPDPAKCRTYKCSPFLLGWELHDLVRRDPFFKMTNRQAHHVYLGFGDTRVQNERTWGTKHKTLFDYGMRGGPDPAVLYCFHSPPTGPEAVLDRKYEKRTPTWDLGIAGGALLRQDIFPDPIQPPFSRWDVEGARFVNIQILNAVAFTMATGLPTPPTPVTPQVYAGYGLPYAQEFDEETEEEDIETMSHEADSDSLALTTRSTAPSPLPSPTNPLLSLPSISQHTALLQSANLIPTLPHLSPSAPATACTACTARGRDRARGQGLCDQVLRPCNHAVCGECAGELVVEMMRLGLPAEVSGGALFVCPLCAAAVVETVVVAGGVKVPGDEGRGVVAAREGGFVVHGVQVGRR